MNDTNDQRTKLIEKYKNKLIENTAKIPDDEMPVVEDLMRRLYQMGWLEIIDQYCKRQTADKGTCGSCKHFVRIKETRCGKCLKREYLKDRWGSATDRPFIPAQSRRACVDDYEQME